LHADDADLTGFSQILQRKDIYLDPIKKKTEKNDFFSKEIKKDIPLHV